jgi:hypothetical protein
MKTTVLTSTLALAVGVVTAGAEQFPYREPGPLRTVFVEAATKACIRDNEDPSIPKKAVSLFCECKVAVVATNMTAKDMQEIARGGIHVTPRYYELAQTAETACEKAITGQ